MKTSLSIFIFVIIHTFSFSQQKSYLDIIKQSGKNADFEKVRTDVNNYFDSIPDDTQKNRKGYKLWKRWEWFANLHQDVDGRIGDWTGYSEAAMAKISAQPTLQATNGSWSSAGPSSISNNVGHLGRVECVAFHPTDANTFYIGSGSGGVWKTTNLGVSWSPKSDYLPSLSIGGLAVHPSNGNIVYALTGDGDGGNQWGYYVKARSAGVFKSTDGGDTWAPTGLSFDRTSEEEYGYKLIINPSNGNNLFAATSAGIWRTTDGGNNWTREVIGEFTDIEFRPNNSNHLVATAYGVDDLYISTDGGLNWRQKDVPGTGMTRADLAVSANTPNNVYMLMGPEGNGNFRGYYRFLWTDSSFTLLTTTPNVFTGASDGSGDGGFAWWAIALGVSPTNANNQLVGGVIGRRSTDGGATIFADNDILHADQHGYWYSPVDGSVFATNDGGVMRSTNNGSTWTNLTEGLRITQFYRISGTPENINMILGGTQDNGHYVRYANTSQFLHTLTCCDGMDNAVDPTNSQILYMCSQNGGLVRSTDGGANWSASSIRPEASTWVAPIALHTTTPTTIFFAGNTGVWRSTNSGLSGWVNVGADGRGAIAQGTSNTARFYAAGNNTTLRRSDDINDATPAWSVVSGTTGWPTTGLTGSQITGIAVNPSNSNEAWVSLSGYNAANKVLRTTNGGTSWANLTGSLPNVPVHTIKFAGTGSSAYEIYVGTDVGVFYRSNLTSDWIFFSNGLPRVIVTDLEINDTYIYAGTYGRGIWRSALYSSCPASYNFSLFSLDGELLYQASSTIDASVPIIGGTGTNVNMRAGSSVTLTPGFEVKSGNVFRATIGPCNQTLPLGPVVPLPILPETESTPAAKAKEQ